jgi:threonine/homoserine/homoserine lactone efflux protein
MIDVTALVTYFAVMSITPGPNNVMVTSSGAAYGYRATLPHVLGIGLGAALQMVLVALGVGVVFQRFPVLHTALAIVAAVYLVYLAWQLLRAGVVGEGDARRPFTVWQAVLFQAVNPKAWVMAITTAAVFLPQHTPLSRLILVVGGLFLAVNIPCVSVWALFGSAVRHLLLRPTFRTARRRQRVHGDIGLRTACRQRTDRPARRGRVLRRTHPPAAAVLADRTRADRKFGSRLCVDARLDGILLANGSMFSISGQSGEYLRINAAYGSDPVLTQFLGSRCAAAGAKVRGWSRTGL